MMHLFLISMFLHFLLNGITTGLYNAALYKPAVQSTTFSSSAVGTARASLAVDGNRDTNVHNGHCQHTQSETKPWWMVDLRGQFVVDTIRLTNRMDWGLYTRLRNYSIDVFDQDPRQMTNFPNITGNVCYKQIDPTDIPIYNITCTATGRFVRLLINGSSSIEVLHICEMEVFVSDFLSEENIFNVRVDSRISSSVLDNVTVSDPTSCVRECLARRSSTCTAFNWVTTSKTCQLFSVDPALDLTSSLTSAPGTHFYIQDNLL